VVAHDQGITEEYLHNSQLSPERFQVLYCAAITQEMQMCGFLWPEHRGGPLMSCNTWFVSWPSVHISPNDGR
jgi:hypothetical protein